MRRACWTGTTIGQFDLLRLNPLAPGETRDEASAAPRLTPGDCYASAPGMSPGLGSVYDQDTDNLDMHYKGFQASRTRGEMLGNDQEARIRRFHFALHQIVAE